MDDILASIRKILNEDEPVGDAAHQAQAAAPGPAVSHEPAPRLEHDERHQPGDDDVFVLDGSMLVEEPPALTQPTLSGGAAPPIVQTPSPPGRVVAEPERAPASPTTYPSPHATHTSSTDALMAPTTAAAASASMGALVRVMGQQQTPVYRGGPTLEDMVRDELRPMVKSWLDEHLAPMVERLVRAEIARVTEGK